MSEVIARYNEFDSFHSEQMDELSILQALQMEEDAKIALDLQFMERQRAGQQANSKYFTVLEKQVYDFNHEEEDEEESEDEVEKVYDKFQLDEDKEISSVVPKREGKNGSHLAMHHKVYPTKNKGKFMDKTIMLAAQKNKSGKRADLPKGVNIGLVNDWSGNRQGKLYCWSTGATFTCRTMKSACKKYRKIGRGDIVYFRLRPYQTKMVDIVSLADDSSAMDSLQEILNRVARDPISLQYDVVSQIFFHVGITYHSYKRISKKWNEVLCKVMDAPLRPLNSKIKTCNESSSLSSEESGEQTGC